MPINPYTPPNSSPRSATGNAAIGSVGEVAIFAIAASLAELAADIAKNGFSQYLARVGTKPLIFLYWEMAVFAFACSVGAAIVFRSTAPESRRARIVMRTLGGLVLGFGPRVFEPVAKEIHSMLPLSTIPLYTFIIMLLLAFLASAATERTLRSAYRRPTVLGRLGEPSVGGRKRGRWT